MLEDYHKWRHFEESLIVKIIKSVLLHIVLQMEEENLSETPVVVKEGKERKLLTVNS